MISRHASERATNRFNGMFDMAHLERLCAVYSTGAVAVVIAELEQCVRDYETGSNGDLIVAVVRGGLLHTLMLRRSTQKLTAKSLAVDFVVWDVKNE